MRTARQKASVVIVAALLMSVSAGCVKPPIVKIHGIDVESFDFEKINLLFDMKVTNPNGFELNFSSLNYTVTSAGTEIVHGALPTPVMNLPANKTSIVRVPVSVELANLAPLLSKIRAKEEIPYRFSTESKFHFLGLKIPVRVSRNGLMPALRKPSWRFRKVRYVKGPPSWMELSFEVDNPNTFELPLEELSGALKYGDEVVMRINEPNLKPIAPGKTAMFTVRARADGKGVAKAFARRIISRQRQKFTFDGRLKMGVPKLLKKMLLEKSQKDD